MLQHNKAVLGRAVRVRRPRSVAANHPTKCSFDWIFAQEQVLTSPVTARDVVRRVTVSDVVSEPVPAGGGE
ncbi:hypothetical protein FHX52_2105 [Humibacillus xanthopallidus]|uniref:Uncharacterized protein n=1 Tax=Humibacillus xanthopallidus TaxID=412689 RepID=A0A543PY22_9MICO|nr:hypothetical protein FHX52_2105 [Humibacillus xanthopallidus]